MSYFKFHRRQFLKNTPEFNKVLLELKDEFREQNRARNHKEYLKYKDSIKQNKEKRLSDPVAKELYLVKCRELAKKYREKNPKAVYECQKRWVEKNKERVRATHRKYLKRNPEKAKLWAHNSYLNRKRRLKENALLKV